MTLGNVLIAFLIAIFLTVIFVYGFGSKGSWASTLSFFLVIFLGVWASSLWIVASGPFIFNVSWIPLLYIGIIISLLLAAAIPVSRKESEDPGKVAEKTAYHGFNAYFWILIVALGFSILIGYLMF